jgi:pyruvate kinase
LVQVSRQTKIVATLGPATESPEAIARLMDAGVDIFRLNMSHATHDWVRQVVRDIRALSRERGRYVGILMDTQGPAIRTGDLPVPLDLTPGQRFTLTVRGERSEEECSVDVNYPGFVNDISVGDVVLIDNGVIRMKVLGKQGNHVECEVLTEGTLGSRRHINLPGVKVNLPALTSKDKEDVKLGMEVGVDFVALSFVREAADLRQLRELLAGARQMPQIVAKVEDQQAVGNIEEIALEADAIMVARGDLGIEVPFEELPIIQRRIIKLCARIGRPVIVATHMLESMIQSPMPTRAEVTDVANAVFEQTDAIMLSGETTVGKWPTQCVEVFNRIARRIELSGGAGYSEKAVLTTARQKMVRSAVVMANELKARAILVFTRRGFMARYTGWLRPKYSAIFAMCETPGIAHSLSIVRGVTPFVIPYACEDPEANIDAGLRLLIADGHLTPGDVIVIISSITSGEQIVDAVQMRTVEPMPPKA